MHTLLFYAVQIAEINGLSRKSERAAPDPAKPFYFRFLVYKRSMPQNGIAAFAAAALLPLRSSSAAASLEYTSRCFGQRLCEQFINLRHLLLHQVPKSPISCAVLFLSHCRPPGFCLCISIIPRLIWLFFLSYFRLP